ncbi:hypothetical protein [Saccharopolyspora spinosa]|uniref:hypothetical protein n=1 Tax=Saccharopolyspora spinosa TaxID=60894 RepID=UPI0002379277|nr:hypothetical protein [Saccharopolyspora spinosa]
MLTPADQAAQEAAQQRQKKKEENAKFLQARKAKVARFAELEKLKGQGQLTEAQETELAALQPKVAHWKQLEKARNAKDHQARKAAAARVAVLEALKEQGPLTGEQTVELAELQPKVAHWQKRKEGWGCQVFGVTVDFGSIGVRRTGVRRR